MTTARGRAAELVRDLRALSGTPESRGHTPEMESFLRKWTAPAEPLALSIEPSCPVAALRTTGCPT